MCKRVQLVNMPIKQMRVERGRLMANQWSAFTVLWQELTPRPPQEGSRAKGYLSGGSKGMSVYRPEGCCHGNSPDQRLQRSGGGGLSDVLVFNLKKSTVLLVLSKLQWKFLLLTVNIFNVLATVCGFILFCVKLHNMFCFCYYYLPIYHIFFGQ